MNRLYFGDNLTVLRDHVRDESVDLIYLDPPFNSQAAYNLLYKSPVGGDAQLHAFEDTWRWDTSAALALNEVGQRDADIFNLLQALRSFLGQSDVMAYLAMMAVRFIELRRVLKADGSLYLHCDPTASHYLKILMDGIFGPDRFLNEIVWKRHSAHNSAKRYGPVHDVILFYGKGERFTWTNPRRDYDDAYLAKYYKYDDGDGRLYWRNSITAAGVRNGSSGRPWRGFDPGARGSHWKFTTENLDALELEGKIYWPPNGGWPQIKRYRDDLKGLAISDVWDDIDKINPAGNERLGYPTQKPLALLERIIGASSRPGEIILDPFCGCGTAIHAAERLGRSWIGIDIAYPAIQVIEDRIGKWLPGAKYEVAGIPSDEHSARKLAERDPFTFQQWAVGRLGGQSRGKGADKGIDGQINFAVGQDEYWRAIVSVKGGRHVNPDMVRALKGVVEREGAQMGIFVCLDASREMRAEAAASEIVQLPTGPRPRVQILTVADLIANVDTGIRARLNAITSADVAKAVARRKPPKRPAAEKLRSAPPLPPMPIKGGKKPAQAPLLMDEPLLTQAAERPTRRWRGK